MEVPGTRAAFGTENLPAIVGMAAAARIAADELPSESARLEVMRDRLITAVLATSPTRISTAPDRPSAQQRPLPFEGVEGESLLLSMKDAG